MEKKRFFENLKIWSKRKHRLLEKYLPPFSAKVASTTINREVYCVDGFAGAAKYDDGSEGSPVLMAKFSDLTTEAGEEILLREYISNLGKSGFIVVDYAIREALNKKPKYHFIYCTRHNDGVYLMNDFIREEDDLIYGEYVEDKLPMFQEEASLSQEISKRRESLRNLILDYLNKNNRVTRKQIKHNLIFENFGFFHNKDYNFVVQKLMADNLLREKNGKNRINDNDFLEYFPN